MSYLAQMKTFTFTLWFFGISGLTVLAVLPNVMVVENGADKMLHIAGFCFLTLWPTMTFIRRNHIYMSAMALIAAGMAVEILQAFAPTREPSIEDMMANIIGVVAGLVIGFLIRSDTLRY